MKKSTKKILFSLAGISLLILTLGYLGVFQMLMYQGEIEPPIHIQAGGTNRYSCNIYPDYKYNNVPNSFGFNNYKVKYNVDILLTRDSYETFEDNRGFRMDDANRYGDTPHGISFYALTGGIPAQVKCDGTLDCKYGYTNEEWELKGNKCYVVVPKITIYRLINNSCDTATISATEKTTSDYDTLAQCSENIVITVETPTQENLQETKTIECNSNIECQSVCGTKVPTCEQNTCFCSGQQLVVTQDKTPIYYYLVPVLFIGIIAFIVWQRMKKPRRKKK
jgi:hypothetical protein